MQTSSASFLSQFSLLLFGTNWSLAWQFCSIITKIRTEISRNIWLIGIRWQCKSLLVSTYIKCIRAIATLYSVTRANKDTS